MACSVVLGHPTEQEIGEWLSFPAGGIIIVLNYLNDLLLGEENIVKRFILVWQTATVQSTSDDGGCRGMI